MKDAECATRKPAALIEAELGPRPDTKVVKIRVEQDRHLICPSSAIESFTTSLHNISIHMMSGRVYATTYYTEEQLLQLLGWAL